MPPQLIVSVMAVEGGDIGTVSLNANRTADLGVMQVNTGAWLPLVAEAHFHGDRSLAYQQLRDNACYNIQVGTWILRQAIDEANGDLWRGVAFYHSHTPGLAMRYTQRVQRAYLRLFGWQTPDPGAEDDVADAIRMASAGRS